MEQSKPVWDAFIITERGDGKAQWKPIGVAFRNKDDSINVLLDAFPKDGKLQLRNRENGFNKQQNSRKEGGHE